MERDRWRTMANLLAFVCFAVWTWTSYARWAGFAYRTFDLAYYVQALWQLIHGRFDVSVQYVPLLGNHVEPIVFLITPIFFVFRHPMLFVVLQNAALASMGPVAYAIGRRLGFDPVRALLLAAALLLAPATGYIALHEFHPEALTAPFLLLMLRARLSGSLARHWLWFVAVLACKENMAPLLAAYCAVQCLAERKRGFAHLRQWYLWPMALALIWFVVCVKVITPAFNSGNIDYGALYERLGSSGGEILQNALTKPQLIFHALGQSLTQGNLLWALLLPFLCLPILRPKWLLIASPLLLQHLLSWRSSEWTIYFHYAAPLLPLFWLATAEALAGLEARAQKLRPLLRVMPLLVVFACLGGQMMLGPAAGIVTTGRDWWKGKPERARKNAFLAAIPADASVVAPLPYLSHLALRRELHSLHYILKGLKTLSRSPFTPPLPTEYVLIDYGDSATFDRSAGFYHPTMKTVDGRIVPSSDHLLHDFLKRAPWESHSADELTLLRRTEAGERLTAPAVTPIAEIGHHTKLFAIEKSRAASGENEPLEIKTIWQFEGERELFPWMVLRLIDLKRQTAMTLTRGLCAPEASEGFREERWVVTSAAKWPKGRYGLEVLLFDHTKTALLAPPIPLGEIELGPD